MAEKSCAVSPYLEQNEDAKVYKVKAEAGIFEGIIGNAEALRRLERSLAVGEVSHAYLFYGPPGVGKRTVARRFGAALVSGGDERAEDRARRGLHPDLQEVEPEGVFTTIGQVREIVRQAASRPFEGARRVFILQADTLNVQAANALLKTLEEPEGRAVFLLLAASREGVLPTIVSRAQTVRFNPVPVAEVAKFLREQGDENPELVAALGRGNVGLSLRYARETEMWELRKAVFTAAFSFAKDFGERRRAVEKIVDRAEAVGEARETAFLEDIDEPDRRAKESAKRLGKAARDGAVREALGLISLVYRDVAVVNAGAEKLVANLDRLEEIQDYAERFAGANWAEAALEVGEIQDTLAYNASPEAVLEVALSRVRQKILGAYPD